MIQLAYSILGFVVALGILVTVHEFGHFWVARRLGVKVLRFSVGFGRPLWSRHGRDGVEYVIGALPLGGYVKMLDENEGEVPEAERHRAFNRKPVWRRALIVLAGPAFNFLFAILAYWLVFMVGIQGLEPVIGQVAEDSPAEQAGFQPGERIVRVDGRSAQTWDEHRMYLFNEALGGESVTFVVETPQGQQRERVLDLGQIPIAQLDAGFLERAVGLRVRLPQVPPVVGEVAPESPAAAAGLEPGDRIVAVAGAPVRSWNALVTEVSARPGEAVTLEIERDGARIPVTVTPRAHRVGDQVIGRIGVAVAPVEIPDAMRATQRYGPLLALWRGAENTWVMSALTVQMLGKMLLLEVSSKNISGPLTIAQFAGQSAQVGLQPFVMFLAIVSISLGILNLLPIPVLDGGHLLYHLAEAIKGRPLSEEVMLWGQQAGILLLIGLMGLAFYNDLVRLLQ